MILSFVQKTIEIQNTGSAIYVYCILGQATWQGNTDMTFYVDDIHVGEFFYDATSPIGSFIYNQLAAFFLGFLR